MVKNTSLFEKRKPKFRLPKGFPVLRKELPRNVFHQGHHRFGPKGSDSTLSWQQNMVSSFTWNSVVIKDAIMVMEFCNTVPENF